MSAKIFLFTGEESYLLSNEIKRWKTLFAAKYGHDNIKEYASSNFSLADISNDLFGSGLFSEKKLIVMYGIPDDTFAPHKIPAGITSELAILMEKKRENINPDNIVIFVSYTPDKRKKLYKFLTAHVSKHQEFKKMKGKTLLKFVLQEAESLLSEETARFLIERVGTDTQRLIKELDKLRTYC